LVPLHFYMRPGIPYTHDGENHLARFANYKLAIKEGQFPPRFAPNLANRYGYPVFNYNYPLANIVSLPFSVLKVPYILTFKLIVSAFIMAGLVGVWSWLRSRDLSPAASWLGVAAFGTSPYLVAALLYRGNIGEIMALCLLPWLLWLVEKSVNQNVTLRSLDWLLVPLLWAVFFLSHNVAVLIGTPFVLIYALVRIRFDFKTWLTFLTGMAGGIGLSFWFWLPALVEKSEVVLDKADLSIQFYDHFVTTKQLLFSALTFGYDFPGSIDSLSFQLGWFTLSVILLAVGGLLRWSVQRWRTSRSEVKPVNTMNARLVAGSLVAVVILAGLQLSLSQPLWQFIPILRFVQFPWRFMLLLVVVLPLLAAACYEAMAPFWRRALWLMVVLQVVIIWHLKPVDLLMKTNAEYDSFSQTTSTLNENLPVTFTYGLNGVWQPAPTFLSGEGTVEVQRWTGSDREYLVKVTSLATLVEPTMYFLGWETTVVDKATSQSQQVPYVTSAEVGGRIGYQLPSGEYQVRSRFTQHTWSRQLSHVVTIVTCLALGIRGLYLSWGILKAKGAMRQNKKARV
jgi:hypothetical protein